MAVDYRTVLRQRLAELDRERTAILTLIGEGVTKARRVVGRAIAGETPVGANTRVRRRKPMSAATRAKMRKAAKARWAAKKKEEAKA